MSEHGGAFPEAEKLVHELSNETDSSNRTAAAEALGRLGSLSVVPTLIKALDDESMWVARAAAGSLGDLRDPRAIAPLVRAFEHEHCFVREAALTALGRIGDRSAAEPMLRMLEDGDLSVREAALTALGALGDARALPRIREIYDACERGDERLRTAAIGALCALEDPAAVRQLIEELRTELTAPGSLDGNAISLRQGVAEVLGRSAEPSLLDLAIEVLDDLYRRNESTTGRPEIPACLGTIGTEKAVDLLCEILCSPEPDPMGRTRDRAAEVLGELGGPKAVDALRRAIRDARPERYFVEHEVEKVEGYARWEESMPEWYKTAARSLERLEKRSAG